MDHLPKDLLQPVKPRNWLVESILVTVLCCLPFGIVGIVYAAKVDSLYQAGRYEEAEKASQEAGKWTRIALFTGLGIALLYGLLIAMIMAFDLN